MPDFLVRAIIAAQTFTMAITIQKRQADKLAILAVAGRLTVGEASSELHAAVKECVAAGDKDVVIDMRQILYVDSAGLGALVASLTCARNSGGTLRLANVPRRIQDLLDVSSLHMVFQIIELASTKIDT